MPAFSPQSCSCHASLYPSTVSNHKRHFRPAPMLCAISSVQPPQSPTQQRRSQAVQTVRLQEQQHARQQHHTKAAATTMEPARVRVEQECDFDGRAVSSPGALSDLSPLAACFDSGGPQHSLVYTGLEGAGPHLAFLTAKVHFSVNPEHKSESMAGPMEVGADGRVYAAVQYPSLRDLWPEVYHNRSIRVVQVDVFVEVQSGPTSIKYPGTDFKVTYRRRRTPADNVVLWRPQDVLHTIRR